MCRRSRSNYSDIIERSLLAEELGFDSLWFYDHLYGPGLP